jgi:serine/threonine-protein kinase
VWNKDAAMNRSFNVEEPWAEDDSCLGHLVDEVTRRLQAGERIELENLLAAHPIEAERLRTILPTLEAMAELGRSSGRGASEQPSVDPENSRPVLIGDYRILREIGRGGMGIVYEAQQRSLNRRVALKVLPMAAALDARQFQRFQLEAQAAACLHHQNIVPVFAIGTEGGVPYYAMQYIDGRSLAELIRELRRAEGRSPAGPESHGHICHQLPDLTTTTLALSLLPDKAAGKPEADPGCAELSENRIAKTLASRDSSRAAPSPSTPLSGSAASTRTRAYARTVAGLGLQAAEALDHAHIRGILHRDIKPGNLLLDAEGRLWIADFGLAQIQGSHDLTLSGDVLGTLRYMSPEQALGKRVVIDGRSDVYSLGVTLYELLTLNPAYAGKERAELLRRIAEEELPSPRRSNPAVPIDLETIIRKATYKDPADRYATAQDLADDLRRFLDDQPITAVRPGAWVRARKWMRRHREATLAIAVAATVVILSAGVWAWGRTSRRIQLSQRVGRMLEAARASLQSNDPAAAQQHLAEARGHLDQSRDGQGTLATELAQLSRAVTTRIEAEERYHQFQDLQSQAQSSMNHLGGDERASAREQCRTALGLYRVLDAGAWEQPETFRALPPVLQVAAREGIHE